MKEFITILCMLLVHRGFSQNGTLPILTINKETGKITFTEVTAVNGASKSELKSRALMWFTNNSAYTVEISDKTVETIIAKNLDNRLFLSDISFSYCQIWCTITIAFKEGKYKYEISEIRYQEYVDALYEIEKPAKINVEELLVHNLSKNGKSSSNRKMFRDIINKRITLIIENLNSAMQTPLTIMNSNDW